MSEQVLSPSTAVCGNALMDYWDLTKPRLTLMALATVLLGFLMGSAGFFNWRLLVATLFGSWLVGAGANSMNQWLEKDIDARMKRTVSRPLPSGRIGERPALIFGVLIFSAGVLFLLFFVNGFTGFLGASTFLSYVLIYTPLKRKTVFNTFVGAVPGALPSLMGWAGTGHWSADAFVLFLLVYLWQLPHFMAIAWVYREDYLRSGLKVFSIYDGDGKSTAFRIFCYCLILVPVSLVPAWVHISGRLYFLAAGLAGGLFLLAAWDLGVHRLSQAKRFVTLSIAYLLVLIIFMIADKIT